MLPFQSRIVDLNSEELSTDDLEVVHHVRNASKVAPSSTQQSFGSTLRSSERGSARRSDRPQIPAPVPASSRASASKSARLPAFTASSLPAHFQENEDEMTCLMPSKLILPAPPPSDVDVDERVANLRPMSFQAQPQSVESQSFRPQSRVAQSRSREPMYTAQMHTAPKTAFDGRTAPERLRTRTPQPMRVMAARQESYVHIPAPPPSLAPMAMPSVDSDPRFVPGATVLTSRSLAGRPTASWAAALVVMGIFAGIVTAAVARGDLGGDAKVAAASQQSAVQQVIPSQAAAGPAVSYLATGSAPMAIGAPVTSTQNATPAVIEPAPLAAAPAPAPIAAKFTPTPRVAAAPRATASAPVAHVSKPRSEEPKEKKEVATKSKKDVKGGDDLASAKEAQALADAQLAASL